MRYIRNFNLQRFCLSVILHNIEKVINCRHIPQKHVDFLLRRHGKEVFLWYYARKSVSDDSMIWFLNPYCKKIKLVCFSEKIAAQLQVVGPAITALCLSESLASENMLNSIICCVPHVEHIDFSFTDCTDKNLLCVQKMCPDIVSLNLQECSHISDDGLIHLRSTNLKHINLIDTNVTDNGLYQLFNGIPTLQTIKHEDLADALYSLNKSNLESKTPVHYNLTELIYSSKGSSCPKHVIWAWTILCPYVTKVHVEFPLTREMLVLISRFKHLTDLKINFNQSRTDFPEDIGMEIRHFMVDEMFQNILHPFAVNANMLTTLYLAKIKVCMPTLVECYKSVKWLKLSQVSLSSFVEEEMEFEINNLDTLIINNVCLECRYTCKALLWLLSASQNVSHLCLTRLKELPQEMLSVILSSLKKLSMVDLSFTTLSIDCLSSFFEIPTMEKIFLDCLYKLPNYILNLALSKYVTENSGNSFAWRLWECDDDFPDDCFDETDYI